MQHSYHYFAVLGACAGGRFQRLAQGSYALNAKVFYYYSTPDHCVDYASMYHHPEPCFSSWLLNLATIACPGAVHAQVLPVACCVPRSLLRLKRPAEL